MGEAIRKRNILINHLKIRIVWYLMATTTFNDLPFDIHEKIYAMKHNMELRDVLNEMKEWGHKNRRPLDNSIPRLHLYVIHMIMQIAHEDSSNRTKYLHTLKDKNQITDLTTYSLKMLKTQCKNNNVKVSGTKRELVNRLMKLA